jgi:TDG/mug DNA glycosylase family protein
VAGRRATKTGYARAPVRIRGFAPVVGRAPRVLILGSMPSEASLAAGEYYGLPRNAFWTIMGQLFGAGRELAYADRLAVLKRAGIALWDVLAECRRPGSLDSAIDLKSARTNDLVNFYQRHRSIRRIFFNGSKAADIYRRRILPEAQIVAPYLSHARLPSTSPAMASLSLDEKTAAWQVLAADSRSNP